MTDSPWTLDRHAGKAGWRRALLGLLVLATAAFGGSLMWTVLGSDGFKVTEVIFFAIFVVISTPVGFHHQFQDPGIPASWKLLHTFLTMVISFPPLAPLGSTKPA